MSTFSNLLVLIIALWLIAGVVLVLHRLSSRFGLSPLVVFLGGVTAVFQLQGIGWVPVVVGNFSFGLGSHFLLPILLFGLLIIYVINGTFWGRGVLIGIVIVSLITIGAPLLLPLYVNFPGNVIGLDFPLEFSPRVLFSSIFALILDLVVLILAYQYTSNLRHRYPSGLAGCMALLMALWSDAISFSLFAYGGSAIFNGEILMDLLGKTLVVFILCPLIVFYLRNMAPNFPDSAATTPRPLLDFFTTSLQLEAQARYHYSLLRTLSEINQLVFRSTDTQHLLQRACNLLVESRSYGLVWISRINDQKEQVGKIMRAGSEYPEIDTFLENEASPYHTVVRTGKSVVVNTTESGGKFSKDWQEKILHQGFHTIAAFPLRQADKVLGVINICISQAQALDKIEIGILQELADDLAYAMVSLDARRKQAVLQTAAETMQDGLIIFDLRGKISYANSVISQFLEKSLDEILKLSVVDLVVDEQAERFPKILRSLLKNESISFVFDYHLSNERSLPLSINASLLKDRKWKNYQIVANIRDITSQRHYEKQLSNLNRLTTKLVQIRDFQTLLFSILVASEDLIHADASIIYLMDADGKSVEDVLVHNVPQEYAERIARDYRGLPGEKASRTEQPVVVNDTLNAPEFGERIHFMAEYDIRSLLILPILYQDDRIGALTVYSRAPHRFKENNVQLGLTLTHTLAILIKNARLYRAENEQHELSDALAKASIALNSSLDPDKVLILILEQIMRIVPCKAANVCLVEGEYATIAHHRGYDDITNDGEYYPGYKFPLSLPTLKHMVSTGQPILLPDTHQSRLWKPQKGSEWIRSYAGVPLEVGQKIIGLLNVDSDRPNQFSEETIKYLLGFAAHAAAALQNARLYASIRRRADEMAALATAAMVVSSSLESKEILRIVAEQMTKTLNVQACAISDYDSTKGTVTLLTEYGPEGWDIDKNWYEPFDLEQYPLTRQVLETQTPIQLHMSDPNLDSSERKFMADANIETLFILPLVVKDQVIGLVELMDTTTERTFSAAEISLGQSLASHAAVAIQNADLYQRLQEYADELETRVKQRTTELREAKESIEGILASAPDAVFVLDENHRLVQANQAGEILIENARQNQQNLLTSKFLEGLATSNLPDIHTVLEIQDRAYQARSSLIRADEGQSVGQVIVFRDVTRFRELDQMKSQFITDVSHELRTPLTNVTLYLGLLDAVDPAQSPDKNRAYLDILRRETDRLTHLIEDFLTFSLIESQQIGMQLRPVNINQCIEDLVSDRKFLAAQQEVKLSHAFAGDILEALVDTELLEQALSNLLTNAINYTQPGGNIILQTSVETKDDQKWIVIHIADEGIGIQPDEITYIFDRFYRGTASEESEAEGTGLGLAISKEIIIRMGGDITVQSVPGEGSTFTIWLRPVT